MPQRIGQRVSLVDPSQLARIIWATSQLNSLEVVLIITAERVRASASSLLGTKYNCSVRRTAFHSPILMRVIRGFFPFLFRLALFGIPHGKLIENFFTESDENPLLSSCATCVQCFSD